MPRLSCWFLRSAFIHLILGFTFGSLILIQKGIPFNPKIWVLLPAHIELVLFGWTVQLIMGVGFWIFPRFRRKRGNERFAWFAFGLINLGLWLTVLNSIFIGSTLITFGGRLAELAGITAFVLHAWPRIKPPGTHNI